MNIRPNTPTDSQHMGLDFISSKKERKDLELANQHTATSLDVSMCDQYFNIENGYMSKPNRIIDHISSDISDDEDNGWGAPICLCAFVVLISIAFIFREDMLKLINPKTHLKT